ncbi:MAG: YkgJ family cysteine cluster protein [Nitrospirota bacterium]|nr:YkgJ family cysteine cluster protein [Nitrospirota bacterium]MDP2381877.1 YkgJ family cysteine cluster protein [Nitrospirota bacterium]MDP3598902.1 YkgJ family cysteine cluster protein [Nitrospirota bacterium]
MVERFEVALNTPAGRLTTAIDVPTGLIPITAIVPVSRRLGEEAAALEVHQAREAGLTISCQMGCAACCRMLVPLSAPEAFALREYVEQLPTDRRTQLQQRISTTKDRLTREAVWDRLNDVAEASRPMPDEELDPINRAYYALRIPCPYLEDEMCSIYEARPAACRELLVTSPAELCQDLVQNPVTPLPVSMRIGSILGLVWGTLTDSPPRLIPLPMALEWAERHVEESRRTWPGSSLLDQVLDNMWRFLSQAFTNRHEARGERREAPKETDRRTRL